jgi:hypothetical protein
VVVATDVVVDDGIVVVVVLDVPVVDVAPPVVVLVDEAEEPVVVLVLVPEDPLPLPLPDPDVVVVVVLAFDGEAGWLTRPKGPLSPGPGGGVAKGFEGCPGWLTPRARTTRKAAPAMLVATREPIATGRATATMRSRRDSVRRRSSSSGVRCSC